jgi:hypothetical protein
MNISMITPGTGSRGSRIQHQFGQAAQDFKALQSALEAGDLSGAQDAFASLQKNMKPNPRGSEASSQLSEATSRVAKDFAALQTALQGGDLSGAQSAFATLKQDLKGASGLHRGQGRHDRVDSDDTASTAIQGADEDSTSESTGGTSAPLLDSQA